MLTSTAKDNRRSVLVVDEDPLFGNALAREFKALKFAARTATTFEEAASAVASAKPDLVILEFYLGDRSGLDLLRLWKDLVPKLAVVVVSDNSSLSTVVDTMREGASSFFAKPVSARRILSDLERRKSQPPPAFLAPAPVDHRLSARALQAEGVDRFFAISQGLLSIAGFDGYFKMLNPAWEKTLGYTVDELCARPYLELVHPDDRGKASDEAVRIRSGQPIFYYRNRYRARDGSYRWLAWNASPSPSHQLIYASASDVTDAVVAEGALFDKATGLREIARSREVLLNASIIKTEGLEELGRFKDEMATLLVHDLKNPLSVIIANFDYLLEDLKAAPERLEALRDSKNASRRMLQLIANVLDVMRLEQSQLKVNCVPTNVCHLLGEVVNQRRLVTESRQITVEVNLPPEIVVPVDADLLTRTAENILDNAMRYTPRGGRIELEVQETGGNVEARIGNSGKPIPKEARQAIFDKFHQVAPDAGKRNAGLGLYFCRLATEAQGGKIWVEETPRLATVFAIQFPHRQPLPRLSGSASQAV